MSSCQVKRKTCLRYLLALILGLCSLWLVWDLFLKFFRGATTTLHEELRHDYLPLPRFLLCSKERYKVKELSALGLPHNFFANPYPDARKFNSTRSFPDLHATWQRVTWSREDFELDWNKYEGKKAIARVVKVLFQKNLVHSSSSLDIRNCCSVQVPLGACMN